MVKKELYIIDVENSLMMGKLQTKSIFGYETYETLKEAEEGFVKLIMDIQKYEEEVTAGNSSHE